MSEEAGSLRTRFTGGGIQISTDGGATWTDIGGGTPADGSVTNAKLADMANGTVKMRSTAGTGVPEDVATATVLKSGLSGLTGPGLLQFAADGTPTKATAANMVTALQLAAPLLNERVTAGGAGTDLVLNPAGWTLNGDTDGDYTFSGEILTAAGAGSANYTFEPNALATNQTGEVGIFTGSGTTIIQAPTTALYISAGSANAGRITFRATISGKSGSVRHWACVATQVDLTTNVQKTTYTSCYWSGTATVIDGTSRIHTGLAGGIQANSWVKITRNLMTA